MKTSKKVTDQKKLNSDYQWLSMQSLAQYSGQWIAVYDQEIIARNETLKTVLKEVSKLHLKTVPLYLRIPEGPVTT